jgi:hypothetical protein
MMKNELMLLDWPSNQRNYIIHDNGRWSGDQRRSETMKNELMLLDWSSNQRSYIIIIHHNSRWSGDQRRSDHSSLTINN